MSPCYPRAAAAADAIIAQLTPPGPRRLVVTGDEAVQCITAAMAADVPYTTLQRTVLIHPTVSELIPTLLGSLAPLPAAKARI